MMLPVDNEGLDYARNPVTMRFVQGENLNIPVQWYDSNKELINLTGKVFVARIVDFDGTVVGTFTQTVSSITLIYLNLDTTAISPDCYEWDCWLDGEHHLWTGEVECLEGL